MLVCRQMVKQVIYGALDRRLGLLCHLAYNWFAAYLHKNNRTKQFLHLCPSAAVCTVDCEIIKKLVSFSCICIFCCCTTVCFWDTMGKSWVNLLKTAVNFQNYEIERCLCGYLMFRTPALKYMLNQFEGLFHIGIAIKHKLLHLGAFECWLLYWSLL